MRSKMDLGRIYILEMLQAKSLIFRTDYCNFDI